MEVLATYAQTLRGTLSPNMTPWPGRNCCYRSDAGRDARDSIKRPASHTTLDGSLFIARGRDGLQEVVYEVESIEVRYCFLPPGIRDLGPPVYEIT